MTEAGDGSRRESFVPGHAADLVNPELGIQLLGLACGAAAAFLSSGP
jgi:hypothetical protein